MVKNDVTNITDVVSNGSVESALHGGASYCRYGVENLEKAHDTPNENQQIGSINISRGRGMGRTGECACGHTGRYLSDRKRSWLAVRRFMVLISSCMVVQELWGEGKEEEGEGLMDG